MGALWLCHLDNPLLQNNYIKEVLPLLQTFQGPQQIPQLGDLAKGLRKPRPLEFDYRTYTGLGKETLGGHEQNLVCTRTQEKEAVTLKENEPDLPVNVQESLVEAWVNMACRGVTGMEYSSPRNRRVCWQKSFRRSHHHCHYPTPHHSMASGQTTGREHNPTH